MLCKRKNIHSLPCRLSQNSQRVTCLIHKAPGVTICQPTPVLISLFQVNNRYGTPRCFARWPHHSTANRPSLTQTKVGPVKMPALVLTVTPIISPPPSKPHMHWHGAATQIELQMGTSMSQSRGGWDTGHPPSGRLVLPLIDRYLIFDGDSGVLSRAGHRSRWYVWELCGGHEGAPAKWPFRPIPPAPCPLLGIYIQFPSRIATQLEHYWSGLLSLQKRGCLKDGPAKGGEHWQSDTGRTTGGCGAAVMSEVLLRTGSLHFSSGHSWNNRW